MLTPFVILVLGLASSSLSLSFSTHDSALDRVLDEYINGMALRQYDSEQDFLPQESHRPSGHFQDVLLDSGPSDMSSDPQAMILDDGQQLSFSDARDRFQQHLDDLLVDSVTRVDAKSPPSTSSSASPAGLNLRDQEFLEHSPSLFGHQFVQGGAGEGVQRLKPDGSIANIQVVKTDAVLPAYCNPPNPCPVGHTTENGCLEEFENSASFSREYQSTQECMCDTEHMFDCPGSTDENELDTLARTLQNHALTEDAVDRFANSFGSKGATEDGDHRVVAKKFFTKKQREDKDYLTKNKIHYAAREKKGSRGTSERAILPWLEQEQRVVAE